MSGNEKKVYLEILKQIRSIIQEDNLKTGDKLPSERELSDRLNAARSSVREALRALELLGLIETRRGEGTFIKDSGEHRLVEILGTFILETDEAKVGLAETRSLLLMAAIQTACHRRSEEHLLQFRNILSRHQKDETLSDRAVDDIHSIILEAADNRLLSKIWTVVMDYSSLFEKQNGLTAEDYRSLYTALEERDIWKAEGLLREWMFETGN